MANKMTDMSKIRKVLYLRSQKKAILFISKYLSVSRNTVKKYLALQRILGLKIDDLNQKSDSELEELFSQTQEKIVSVRVQSAYDFFPYMDKELKKTGVTKFSMWEEYYSKTPNGLKSSMFYSYYRAWSKKVNPVMHMTHKFGDKMYVDYAGKTLEIVNESTGEIIEVQFFVAILGASQYTYAEASMSQKKEDFINSVENALHYFKGVPAAIVPDNLKSAVTKSSKYEPTVNETFLDIAEHYGSTILPARAYKPRDKSLAEGAVKILYQRLYPKLSKQTFYSLRELNQAIRMLLEQHNNRKLTGRQISRLQLFSEYEQQELSALPQERYEIKNLAFSTVQQNGHILLSKDKHYYSVPYQYIRKKVKIEYTNKHVEIFYKYNRIATHQRNISPYSYTTKREHMASTHQFVSDWTPQRFIEWGASIDESVEIFITQLLEKKQHPEQAYKSCMGVLSLAKKVGNDRLINACKRALEYNIYNYKIVQTILNKGLDLILDENEDEELKLPEHQNIRGDKYYK
ncbi:MAG: transposase [Bacteroidetes bacterium RIFOXYA12_FULL_33_9]|nr:MAG: transposase [Bacteroidetes bacterium RIFOXYA12_FULL_33_9]